MLRQLAGKADGEEETGSDNDAESAPLKERGAEDEEVKRPQTLMDDFGSICLLVFLYVLQGVPLGLITAVPLLLQSRGVTYSQQAVFSLVWWPYSINLLWAPVVDAVYVKRIDGREPNVVILTAMLLPITLLAATQDVAVDGWALTMLSR
ncbi:acetyl-coenzyme A transporter 1 [Aphelenchoides avenae]|nr:acetyl-coenzyme A transporter 1 [Aphelenchus avenae]